MSVKRLSNPVHTAFWLGYLLAAITVVLMVIVGRMERRYDEAITTDGDRDSIGALLDAIRHHNDASERRSAAGEKARA